MLRKFIVSYGWAITIQSVRKTNWRTGQRSQMWTGSGNCKKCRAGFGKRLEGESICFCSAPWDSWTSQHHRPWWNPSNPDYTDRSVARSHFSNLLGRSTVSECGIAHWRFFLLWLAEIFVNKSIKLKSVQGRYLKLEFSTSDVQVINVKAFNWRGIIMFFKKKIPPYPFKEYPIMQQPSLVPTFGQQAQIDRKFGMSCTLALILLTIPNGRTESCR